MKFRISKNLLKILHEARDHLGTVKGILLGIIGKNDCTKRDIPAIKISLLVHHCLTMVGFPQRFDDEQLNLKQELDSLLKNLESFDPFTNFKFDVNEESFQLQYSDLAEDIIFYSSNSDSYLDYASNEKLIELNFEIGDHIIEKVFAANGNLTLTFYSYLLWKILDSEFGTNSEQYKWYGLLKTLGAYLEIDEDCRYEFTQEMYDGYVLYFAYLDEFEDSTNEQLLQVLANLQNDVSELILGSITSGSELIETLLIQLLGHENSQVRSSAIKYLNSIYDGTIWRIESPVVEEVKITGDKFEINFTPTKSSKSYYLVLNLPNKFETMITWHKIPDFVQSGIAVTLDIGLFTKCGFYDYKIVRLTKDSIETIESKRIIVQNRHIKTANIHEIIVDLFKSEKDPRTGAFVTRGSIKKVAKSIKYFEKKGIDTLYVAGIHQRVHDDPYSIQSRLKIEDSIGGEQQFKELLVDGLHEKEMKIIVDLFDRVGSRDLSLQNRQLLTSHLDSSRLINYLHGAEGKSSYSYSSTSLPNYRKKQAWDLLIHEAVEFVREYAVDGLHLDNCHLWPSMKSINKEEMFRKDHQGNLCYTAEEILNGEVVLDSENHTIWTDCTEWPNPLLVKLMKALWENFDQLIVIGEWWQEDSEAVVEMSGVIPRSHALVKNITEDILLQTDGKINVERFKFNDEFLKDHCHGAILLQSSYLCSSRSPLKTFNKSYLTILDTLFLHEVVPVTMHEEIEGLDSETEKYVQYFTHNFREMHATFIPPRKLSFEKLLKDEDEEEKITKEELDKRHFADSVVNRLSRLRKLRKVKPCLQFGTNIPLKCVDSNGTVKTVLAYSRYTHEQVGIIITNFEENLKTVWVDFSALKERIFEKNKKLSETAIAKLEYWDNELKDEYHLINEFLNCPHKFIVKGHESLVFEMHVAGDLESHPEYYGEARNSFVNTLDMIQKANHMESSHIYSNYIKHLVEWYHFHRNPDYHSKDSKSGDNLIDFHKFVAKDPSVLKIVEEIVEKNIMGPIVFVTPELAPWFKIGGLAVMVDELARGFSHLGEDTYIIVPYFHRKKDSFEEVCLDPSGEFGIKYLFNIKVNLGKAYEEFGVHYGEVQGWKVYFLHHSLILFEPYPGVDNVTKLRACTMFSKAALQLLCDIKVIPEVIITNDWFTAFTPGYARDQIHFGTIFGNTSFMHIIHNLDISYEGRFYTSPGETLQHIHWLPNEWLIDPYWADHIINPSRLALLTSDQWCSVSKSYRDQIRGGSPLSPLLNRFSNPFAWSNGVNIKERLEILAKELKKRELKHMDHFDAKRFLQEKYLNTSELEKDQCIFSFVGRITEQKGVDLICSVVEEFVLRHEYKVAFIIGGPATKGDVHGDLVINAWDYLINKFPKNFYANPRAFFYDVPVLSLGSNYCLMPSRFEPGGIVQHEFFIAGTPAVVFGTGGLKDSVSEYNYTTGKGNGFEFLYYDREDLLLALERAYTAFRNREVYRRLRQNAFESAIDVANVSKEWCSEVYRIRGKVFIDTNSLLKDIEDEKIDLGSQFLDSEKQTTSSVNSEDLTEVDFKYTGKSTDRVYVAGSFNNWNDIQYRMGYNHLSKEFHCHIKIPQGSHHYKVKVNGKWILDETKEQEVDENGENVNILIVN